MRLVARLVGTNGGKKTLRIEAAVVRLGRDVTCEVAVDALAYPKVSRLHARIEPAGTGFRLVHLSTSNKTFLNSQPVDGSAPVGPGDSVRLGATGPAIEIVKLQSDPEAEAEDDLGSRTFKADPQHFALLRGSAGADRFELGQGGVFGRQQGTAFLLDHPHVSRQHAKVSVRGGRVVLADLGSANGTFVNGRRLTKSAALERGDRLDIGPFALEFTGDGFIGSSRANNIELAARGVGRVVPSRGTGDPLTLLDDVNLVVQPREFVCLLGPSGSGKSTLLSILSGRSAPTGGTTLVNGLDLRANFLALKEDIVVVPQKDVLHETLTLGEALAYTAELRLPPDSSADDIETCVTDILGVVGLADRRDAQLRTLSGGQLKRASLANEILCRPTLLFLDEVTSGLDEQTDAEMMRLFRVLADSGKTVVCITHNLANVEATCHLVVILTPGGKVAFVGTPAEAKGYFRVERLGDVYARLAEEPAETWQAAFRASPFYARYVRGRMPAVPVPDLPPGTGGGDGRSWAEPARQCGVLLRRYAAVWRGDWVALAALLGQCLIVAALLGMLFHDIRDLENPVERVQRTRTLLFLLAVASFWLGCNTAAKELVKERVLYQRERAFNLRADSYYVAKLLVLVGIAAAQVTLLFGIVRVGCGPPGNPLAQWGVMLMQAVAGTTLGLLISALARTEEVATALVPIVVLPQILLGGVIVPVRGAMKGLAEGFVSTYWGHEGLQRLLPAADLELGQLCADGVAVPLAWLGGHVVGCAVLTWAALLRRAG